MIYRRKEIQWHYCRLILLLCSFFWVGIVNLSFPRSFYASALNCVGEQRLCEGSRYYQSGPKKLFQLGRKVNAR